ncbi:MAG: hypothetical protein KTR16_15560 [Acidiferrobacterales bacterium]|nr:hypothetical protein [Acidiferrobacterales bacterium]
MSFKIESAKSPLQIGLLCAITVHAGLLFIKFKIDVASNPTEPISISLQIEKDNPQSEQPVESVEPVSQAAPVDQEPPQPKPPEEPTPVEQESLVSTDELRSDQVTITRVTNNSDFRQWIQQDTQEFIDSNPDSVEAFAQSFEIPLEEQPEDLEKDISPLGSGLYDTVANVKVTCNLQVILPFQNDWSTSINTSRDCTQRKKFTVDID